MPKVVDYDRPCHGRCRKVTVFTAGCFNRLHKAHFTMLVHARGLGNRLVIALSHDAHNCKPNAVSAEIRQRRLSSLGLADEVVIGDPDRFVGTLLRVDPQILVLGFDQKLPDEETEQLVVERGIQVIRFPWFHGKEQDLVFAAPEPSGAVTNP